VISPPWLERARTHLGLAEIPGKATSPTIARWLRDLRAWWSDDETPWCGTYIAAVMRETGYRLPEHWYRAKGWLEWGVPLPHPKYGAVVIFERAGGGHVGLVTGTDAAGRLLVLGGNQGNRVSIAPFDPARAIGYRWPVEGAMIARIDPPRLESSADSSRNEV
jgi:uncharacterized protein (TIGR02594 family)